MTQIGERKVIVWGKPHVVSVERISKSVWVAVGDYMGESLQVQDRSEVCCIDSLARGGDL